MVYFLQHMLPIIKEKTIKKKIYYVKAYFLPLEVVARTVQSAWWPQRGKSF